MSTLLLYMIAASYCVLSLSPFVLVRLFSPSLSLLSLPQYTACHTAGKPHTVSRQCTAHNSVGLCNEIDGLQVSK